jgi:hypothetical protein
VPWVRDHTALQGWQGRSYSHDKMICEIYILQGRAWL